MPVSRRTLLGCAFAAGMAAAGCGMPLRVFNRCATLGDPGHPVDPDLQARVWAGLDPARCWDAHVHVAGIGTGASGAPEAPWVNPALRSPANPFLLAHFALFANASCVLDDPVHADRSYVERLATLTGEFPPGVRFLLLALDGWHDERGRWVPGHTVLRVPDAYVRGVVRGHPGRFEWAASIHPSRRDALEALAAAVAGGARAVKWVPYFMNIDPASAVCDPFYTALARLGLPLIVHAGWQHPLVEAGEQELGNPLRLRRPLERGVRVVVAHCATQGEFIDTETGAGRSERPSFELFRRLIDSREYAGRLFGDVSALTDAGRSPAILEELIVHDRWRGRLVNGSDYPLPGVPVAVSLDALVRAGFVARADAERIAHIQEHNPLLFDFVVKRVLRAGGRGLEAAVFETARFFGG